MANIDDNKISVGNSVTNIPGRLHDVSRDHVVTGADEVFDDDLCERQSQINSKLKHYTKMAHIRIDAEEVTRESIDNQLNAEINAKQLEIGAVETDLEPIPNSPNLLPSGAIAFNFGWYKGNDSREWVYVITDGAFRVLAGIKSDGSVEWSVGVPTPIINYVEGHVEELIEMLNALDDRKVDKEEGKSLINKDFADGVTYEETPDFASVLLDGDGKILEATRKDGTKVLPAGLEVNGELITDGGIETTVYNPEFASVCLTKDGKILFGVQHDGNFMFGCGIPKQIKDYVDEFKLSIAEYIETICGHYEEGNEYLEVKLDKEGKILEATGKDGMKYLPAGFAVGDYSVSLVENPEFVEATVNEEHQMIEGMKADGTKVFNFGIETTKINIGGVIEETVDNPGELSEAVLDASGRIISYRSSDGTLHEHSIFAENMDFGEEAKEKIAEIAGTSGMDNMSLPKYYFDNDYILNRVRDVQKNILQTGRGDVIGFITDTHPSNKGNVNSGRIFRYIAERTPLRKILFGGDIGPAQPSEYGQGTTAIDAMVLSEIEQHERLDAPLKGLVNIYKARGNHDYAVSEGSTSTHENSWQATRRATRHFLVNDEYSDVVSDDNRDDACYYYFDNKVQKIRYIVADTSDWTDNKTETSNVWMNIRDAQIRWIVEQAILTIPDGYKIIVMSHVPLAEVAYLYPDKKWNKPTIKRLKDILCAVNRRDSISVPMYGNAIAEPTTPTGYVNYDFGNISADVILCLGGHLHGDAQTFEDNICFYTSTGDYLRIGYSDLCYLERQLFGINLPAHTVGTIYENLVNLISVDITNNTISQFRIGLGVDKIFRTNRVEVSVGSTYQMSSSLSNVTWRVHDATGSNESEAGSAASGDAFKHTHASINASTGVLAGISVGGVVVAAYSSSQNTIELFNVVIV